MNPRAEDLIAKLQLEPHPEGGHYREFHRSTATVTTGDGRGSRAALTAIFFLLRAGDASRWHAIRSDELWTHIDGGPLQLLTLDPDAFRLDTVRLGRDEDGVVATAVVRAGVWQAARPERDFTLVTCTVGAGFDFSDLAFMADDARVAERLRAAHPGVARLL